MKTNNMTKLMQRMNEEKAKCAEMLGIEKRLAERLSKRLDELFESNRGSFIEDKVNDLKLRVKAKKAEREMYFTRRTLYLNERDRIVRRAMIRLSNTRFSFSEIAFKQELAAVEHELKDVEQSIEKVVPEYLDAKLELEQHTTYQKEVSEVTEALNLTRAKVTKLRRESSALSRLFEFVSESGNGNGTSVDSQSLAEDLECVSSRLGSKETKAILLLILERKNTNNTNNDEAVII